MTERIYIKPVGEATIIHPLTGFPVGPDGASVPANKYIRRRLADGDAIQAEDPAPDTAPDTTKKNAKKEA